MVVHYADIPVPPWWAILPVICISDLILLIYRLRFHPLSKFPGPRLAGISYMYEFFYEVILRGRYTAHLVDLHRRYGPIVRINPNEVHISDPFFFDSFFGRKEKQDRPEYFAKRFGGSTDTFTSLKHDLHARRRRALCPMFSDKRITDFQPMIRSKIDTLCRKLYSAATAHDGSRPVRINRAWTALVTDIITEYAFARSYDHLEEPDFGATLDDSLKVIYATGQAAVYIPIIFPILSILPDALVVKISPALQSVVGMRRDLAQKVREIRNGCDFTKMDPNTPPLSIFHQLLVSNLPDCDKTDARLGDEAQLIVGAGIVTTSRALTIATYHISSNRSIGVRLRAELATVIPQGTTRGSFCSTTTPDWHVLKSLPYLDACVHEAIRLSHGVTTRSARIFENPITYGDWTIPAGTPIAMTNVHILMNPDIFPNPTVFDPDRWLSPDGTGTPTTAALLKRFFVPFGKGYRQCLGMNLAYAELYLSVATVFSQFEFELVDTDASDVEMAHAYLVPYPKLDSKGVQVRVRCLE